jgi:MFS superfamily sulfate permease-like transporter
MSLLDTTGADTLETLRVELQRQGISLNIARAKGWFRIMLARTGVADAIGRERLFLSVREAIEPHLSTIK